MKKTYQTPQAELLVMDANDILTTSGDQNLIFLADKVDWLKNAYSPF